MSATLTSCCTPRLHGDSDHRRLRQIHPQTGELDKYLSDGAAERLPVQRHTFMQAVGVIEIAAGLLVAAKPKWGGYVVGAWLAGIVANLWTKPEYRDIALRDIGLALGALALARMAADAPRERYMAELSA